MNIAAALNQCRPGARWNLTGDTFEGIEWLDDSPPPTQEELETAWAEIQAQKSWPNAQAFMAAFTLQEKGAISLSTDTTVAALRFELSTWAITVNPSHTLVQTGLNRLVEVGIIDEARKAEIIATAAASLN